MLFCLLLFFELLIDHIGYGTWFRTRKKPQKFQDKHVAYRTLSSGLDRNITRLASQTQRQRTSEAPHSLLASQASRAVLSLPFRQALISALSLLIFRAY